LTVSPHQADQLLRYLDLLEHWNRRINLTALSGSMLVRRLVTEPVWAARQLGAGGRYLDIGSGNGSPAIPWLIVSGFAHGDLVEARQRRAVFLRLATARLGLSQA